MLNIKEIEFIQKNAGADTNKLLLGASKYQGINVKLCVNCIEARKKLASKLPQWHSNTSLVYPFPLSAEQCSSQLTAEYKKELMARLLQKEDSDFHPDNLPSGKPAADKSIIAADLTGGMGVDTFYLSQLADEFHYFERYEELCRATEYNFGELGVKNVLFHNCEIDSQNFAETFTKILATSDIEIKNTGKTDVIYKTYHNKPLDFIFIDPARRSKTDKATKVISLQDYEPNLLELKEILFKYTKYILVKVSPMADIKLNLELLPETSAIHVVSVDNECKELLFLLESLQPGEQTQRENNPAINNNQEEIASIKYLHNIPITAVNISSKRKQPTADISSSGRESIENSKQEKSSLQKYCFTFQEEEDASAIYTSTPLQYLYEPNKSLLKAGAFKSLSGRYNIEKLAPSTHLYTSNELIADFPGKIFKIESVIDFNKKAIKNLAKEYPFADISARNFPLNTNEFKKLSGIKDGGDNHIFAVTLTDSSRKIIITSVM